MASPFPGMNPYLEQTIVWHDFHERAIPLMADILAAQLDPAFVVKIDEHIYLQELPGDARRLLGRGDVLIPRNPAAQASSGSLATLPAPFEGRLPGVDEERQSFLEIRDRATWKIVTVIELLSPTNKNPGPDREQYLAKRLHLLNCWVHFVEIDLLRGGPRMPVENLPACNYCVMVSRWEERPRAGLWPIQIREAMPTIPVPLTTPTPDVQLNLQETLHRLYDAARYVNWIYTGTPEPPLSPEDAAWARQFVPA